MRPHAMDLWVMVLCGLVFAVAGTGVIAANADPAATVKDPPPATPQAPASAIFTDPLAMKVHLTNAKEGDVVGVLRQIIEQTPLLSFEVLRDVKDSQPFRVNGFVMEAGDYPIGAILDKIKKQAPEVSWEVREGRVCVKIKKSGDFADPLDQLLKEAVKGTYTSSEVLRLINVQLPDLEMGSVEVTDASGFVPKAEVTIAAGESVRIALSKLGAAFGVGWGAEVYSKHKVIEVVNTRTGSKSEMAGDRLFVIFGKGGIDLREEADAPPAKSEAPAKKS